MKTSKLLLLALSFITVPLVAQENDCIKDLKKAKKIIKTTSPFQQGVSIEELITPCALNGNAEAENMLGRMYLEGIEVTKDETQAYQYISSAAAKDYANAQYNLGRLYKYGIGCDIDFVKAMDWFEKATANGNQRAAYSLGYMHFKGFGVAQNYSKAVYWFQRSTDAMAQHFLGICYYFGYGVKANEDKALELLLNNPILNSKMFVAYINANKKARSEQEVAEVLTTDPVMSEAVADFKYEPTVTKALDKDSLLKEWHGKLVQYDWSRTQVLRIFPITLQLQTQGATYLKAVVTLEGQEVTSKALWQDQTLYLEGLTFTLDKRYSSNPKEQTLDYTLLSAQLTRQELNGVSYLTGELDNYIKSWTEYGEPMSLVLTSQGGGAKLSEETLLALANQEAQFIKLYPVPFKDELLVQYELEHSATVAIHLTSYDGTIQRTVQAPTSQSTGAHTYTTRPEVPEGLYIVKVAVDGKMYTRMIVKEN